MTPKISIIVPVYNVEKYLRQCLDSVVNQTFSDLEIICVDDCSPDNSAQILTEYANYDERIKIITLEKNGGLGNARNVALKKVTSDYVMFLDSDDWLDLNICEIVYKQITTYNNDFVYFNYYKYYNENKITFNKNKFKDFKQLPDINNINPEKLEEPITCSSECWFKIYKTKFLIDNNIEFLVGRNFEDQIFYAKAFCLAKSVSVIDKPLLYYRQRKSSICYDISYWKDVPNSWQIILKNIPANTTQACKDSIIINSINSLLFWFKRYSKINSDVRNDFYNSLHKIFNNYDENTIERIKWYFDYSKFELIKTENSYEKYKIKLMLSRIFSISFSKKHLIICIMGISLKIKQK